MQDVVDKFREWLRSQGVTALEITPEIDPPKEPGEPAGEHRVKIKIGDDQRADLIPKSFGGYMVKTEVVPVEKKAVTDAVEGTGSSPTEESKPSVAEGAVAAGGAGEVSGSEGTSGGTAPSAGEAGTVEPVAAPPAKPVVPADPGTATDPAASGDVAEPAKPA